MVSYLDIKFLNKQYKVVNSNQIIVFWNYVNTGKWEPDTYKIFSKYIRKNSSVIDIGAFVGATIFLAIENSPANIFFIEANIDSFNEINENIKFNNLDKNKINFHGFNLAISNVSDQVVNFGYDPNLILDGISGANTSSSSINQKGLYRVKTIRLLDFIKTNKINNISLIKIDIEGQKN